MTEADARGAGVTVLLLDGEPPGEDLVAALGAARVRELDELTRRRARHWAQTSFPDATLQRTGCGLTDAMAAIGASPPAAEYVVVVAPALAVWREDAGEAALADLRAGCALSFGPVFDGGLYLFALTRAALAAGDVPPLDLSGRSALAGLVEFAGRSGFEVGLLQAERGLRSADDMRALLVDPLCDEELRRLLSR
jgi:glycosyltransferase A (GT-A) superfamily protein (DUF2064 family)